MKPKTIYLALCLAGVILPYWQFVPWLSQNGLNGRLLLHDLFINRISSFFALDLIVSAIVALAFIRAEDTRLNLRYSWLPSLAVLTVGVSFGLPMFLYMRETQLEASSASATQAGS